MSENRRHARGNAIALGFAASSLSSIALAVVYLLGGQVQLEGLLLGVSLGGLAVGLIVWAKELMPEGPYVEEREAIVQPSEQAGAAGALLRGERAIERRGFLGKMLGAAIVCLGAAAVFPIRSLGARPGRSLEHTEWTAGARLVTLDASPVSPERLQTGGILTVFPEDAIGSADSQALVIRLGEGEYRPLPGRDDWAPANCVAYSKICTHAGCPVGLYQALSHELFCPCHQSVFDVLAGAAPTSGPATRPLPQLPLQIDDDGYLAAAGDFPEPVGPGYWSRGRA